jgi:hypothetical protein
MGAALARADEVRQIAPDMFQPNYRDANAPEHKTALAPTPVAAKPPAPPPVGAPPAGPSRSRPFGGCDPQSHDFAACLGEAAGRADRSVEEAEHSVLAGLGHRPGVNPIVADAAARELRAAGDVWRTLRERECAGLPLIENGLTGSLYERRLICRIRRDIERVEFLRERYAQG